MNSAPKDGLCGQYSKTQEELRMASAKCRLGTTLNGKYRLDGLLGVGSTAAVYHAVHRNGHRVAVKLLDPAVSLPAPLLEILRARFLREGYVANQINHPGAVRILDDDVAEDGSAFLVMDLLHGESLDARWERAGWRLPLREVAELAHELLDVLAAAHVKGIVHLDIKPDNLFLAQEGDLKVLDFGLARLIGDAGRGSLGARGGHLLGTPGFMPPEQALGQAHHIGAHTDIWAVGATMFALISGRYVHEAETVEEMLVHTGSQLSRPLVSVAPATPPLIAAVVDHALEFDHASRWAGAREMQHALKEAYETTFASPLPDPTRRVGPTSNRSSQLISGLNTPNVMVERSQGAVSAERLRRRIPGIRAAALAAIGAIAGSLAFSKFRQQGPVAPHLPSIPSMRSPDTVLVLGPTTIADASGSEGQLASRADDCAECDSVEPRPQSLGADAGQSLPIARTSRKKPAGVSPLVLKDDCQRPYTIDGLGRRIPKSECL